MGGFGVTGVSGCFTWVHKWVISDEWLMAWWSLWWVIIIYWYWGSCCDKPFGIPISAQPWNHDIFYFAVTLKAYEDAFCFKISVFHVFFSTCLTTSSWIEEVIVSWVMAWFWTWPIPSTPWLRSRIWRHLRWPISGRHQDAPPNKNPPNFQWVGHPTCLLPENQLKLFLI